MFVRKRDTEKAQHPRNTTLAVRPEPWFSARGRPKSDFRFGAGAKGLVFIWFHRGQPLLWPEIRPIMLCNTAIRRIRGALAVFVLFHVLLPFSFSSRPGSVGLPVHSFAFYFLRATSFHPGLRHVAARACCTACVRERQDGCRAAIRRATATIARHTAW